MLLWCLCAVPLAAPVAGFDTPTKQWPQLPTNQGKALNITGSIREAIQGPIDFLITGIPMSDDELHQVSVARGVNLIHFATAVTSAVPCYNLSGMEGPLNFSAEVLSGIFLSRIRRWNDPNIQVLNPMAQLPDSEIVVIGHAGEDGSTYAWSDFLSKESREWRDTIGPMRALLKPAVRVRGLDEDEVAALVKHTPNTISYVELWAARTHNLEYGRVRNRAGRYIVASKESMSAAAMSAAAELSVDVRASITDTSGPNDYPISVATWIVAPERIPDPERKSVVLSFLNWVLTKGQRVSEPTFYGWLPDSVIAHELRLIESLR